MSQLNQNRYDQLLTRVGDLKGPGSKVNDVLHELFPTLDVENVPIELLFLTGWRLGMGSLAIGPVVGDVPLVQLFNPAGSESFIVPTRIDISSDTSHLIRYAASNVTLPTQSTLEEQRDTRIGVSENTLGQVRATTQAGQIGATGQLRVTGAVNENFQDGSGLFVLAPGTGVTFAGTTANSSLVVSFLWRERVAQPSELNF